LIWVRRVVKDYPYVKVIGIAGPGEPLANPETFEALRLVHEEFPHLIMCLQHKWASHFLSR